MLYKKKTKEEKQAQLAELAKNINETLDYFIDYPQSMLAFLEFREKFPNYSYRNQLLIYRQSIDSKFVASFTSWKEKGYQINKGEKGLKIFVPLTQREFKFGMGEDDWRTISSATPKEKELIKKKVYPTRQTIKGYKIGYVFDISQTNYPKEKYPELIQATWNRNTNLDFSNHIRGAKLYAEDRGIRIIDKQMTPGHNGTYFDSTHHIEMNTFLENEKYFETLTHELTHSQLHRFSWLSTDKLELQAEVVGALALQYYGIEDVDDHLHYIQSYTEGMNEDTRYKLIKQTLDMASDYIHQVDNFLVNFDRYQSIRELHGMLDIEKYSDKYIRDFEKTHTQISDQVIKQNKSMRISDDLEMTL